MYKYDIVGCLAGVMFYGTLLVLSTISEYACASNSFDLSWTLKIYCYLQMSFLIILTYIYTQEERRDLYLFRHDTNFQLSYLMLFLYFFCALCFIPALVYLLITEHECTLESPGLLVVTLIVILLPTIAWPVIGVLGHNQSQ